MKGIRIAVTGAVIALALTVGGVAGAATLNVDQAYLASELDDYHFRTIAEALAAAQSGDTIQVAGGDYTDPLNITKGVTLQGSGPQLTHQNNNIRVISTDAVNAVTIKGFTITSPSDGINVFQSLSLFIKNNCITGNGGSGIAMGSNHRDTVNIINNTISSNAGQGIINSNTNAPTINIINNIITDNSSFGIYFQNSAISAISRNLMYINRGTTNTGCTVGVNATVDYCPSSSINLTDNQVADPYFLTGPDSHFALDSSSPCRNYGQNSPSALNPDGTRNDCGAYGGPDAAPFWPYGNGPLVTDISANPVRVDQNGAITIKATARVRPLENLD